MIQLRNGAILLQVLRKWNHFQLPLFECISKEEWETISDISFNGKDRENSGILNKVFKPQKSLKDTGIKLNNKLALPVLLYGSETRCNPVSSGLYVNNNNNYYYYYY